MKDKKHSSILDAIEKIALCAAKRKVTTAAEEFAAIEKEASKYGNKWQPPTYLPRLSVEETKNISKDLPFELPVEFYDLYSKGNGYLPISMNDDLDWSSLDNYFIYRSIVLNTDEEWMSLEGCLKLYEDIFDSLSQIRDRKERIKVCRDSKNNQIHNGLLKSAIENNDFPLNLFPLISTENGIYAAICNKIQQDASTIVFLDAEYLVISFIAPSLSSLMIAEAEFMETSTQFDWNKYKKSDILRKYDIGQSVIAWFELE
ncbi:hypothetical protein [Chamaesiphon sp. VAR_48_metabat_403]|uniref:hypothetical protein n=1 Tax=Chamaesiphon sp. VAR_48_metabat_403 TaxID=2964700 RepID=UPI00286E877F|nr:hypothetical protein [Chamaesiphon sp. VAR_48_metabat_403]